MGKASPPDPPDPKVTAEAQTTSNVNTAITNSLLSNTNQITPSGSLTYNQIGTQNVDGHDIPRYEAITQLSPEQQRLYNSQLGVSQGTADLANQYVGRIGAATAKPFSYEGMPAAPQYDEAARVAARDRIIARDQPNMDRDRAALESRLANQGISQGTEAFTTGMDTYNRGVNDYRLGADNQAGAEAQRLFSLQGDARTRAIQEASALRSQPINEVSALLGTGPGVAMPQFINTPAGTTQPTDVAGIYEKNYQAQMDNYKTQQAGSNSMMGSLAGLAGTAMMGFMMSDERVKTDIRRVGETDDGMNIYSYRFKGSQHPEIGLIAQDVEKTRPEAVAHDPRTGLKMVNYQTALFGLRGPKEGA